MLEDFGEGEGNAIDTFSASNGLVSCVTKQYADIRRMVRLFPEVICVDSTFGFGMKINRQVDGGSVGVGSQSL